MPRPWHRMSCARANAHDVVHGEEVRLVAAARAISASSCSICSRHACGNAVAESAAARRIGELAQVARRACRPAARSRAGIRSAARRARTCSARATRSVSASQLGLDRAAPGARASAGAARRSARARSRIRPPACRGASPSACPAAGLRERTCMSTLPAATIGRPVMRATRCTSSMQLVVARAVQQLERERRRGPGTTSSATSPARTRLRTAARRAAPAAPGSRAGRPASARSAPCLRRRRGARGSCPSRRGARATVIQCAQVAVAAPRLREQHQPRMRRAVAAA